MRAPGEDENKRSSALAPRKAGASLCNPSAPGLAEPKELQEPKEQKEQKGAGKENAPPPSSGAPLRVNAALVSQSAKDALQPSRMPLSSPSVPTRQHEAIVVGRSHNTNPPTCRVQGCQTRREFKAGDYRCNRCNEQVEVCPSCATTYSQFMCFTCDFSLHQASHPGLSPELSSELRLEGVSPMRVGQALNDDFASGVWSDDNSPLSLSAARDHRSEAPPQGGAEAVRTQSTDSDGSVLCAIARPDLVDLARSSDQHPPEASSSPNM